MFVPLILASVFATLPCAEAHMQLHHPAPFNATNNPHRTTAPDPYLEYPYDCCGPDDRWTYPCRGYTSLLNTPDGQPTASWLAGSIQNFSLAGPGELGGNHYGGSCQVGFSDDGGKLFRVVKSFEGNCPHRDAGVRPEGQIFDFQVPQDMQPGVKLFAWTWHNREQEFNMNCAAVEVTVANAGDDDSSVAPIGPPVYDDFLPTSTAKPYIPVSRSVHSSESHTSTQSHDLVHYKPLSLGSSPRYSAIDGTSNLISASGHGRYRHKKYRHTHPAHSQSKPYTGMAFENRPLMFVANVGNGCFSPKTTAELKFPSPGPAIDTGDGMYSLELPKGQCGAEAMVEVRSRQAFRGP